MPSILKALLGGEIEHQQNSNRAFVVGASDGFEGLLASSVPNLQFDVLVPPADNPWPELNSKSRLMLILEATLNES